MCSLNGEALVKEARIYLEDCAPLRSTSMHDNMSRRRKSQTIESGFDLV